MWLGKRQNLSQEMFDNINSLYENAKELYDYIKKNEEYELINNLFIFHNKILFLLNIFLNMNKDNFNNQIILARENILQTENNKLLQYVQSYIYMTNYCGYQIPIIFNKDIIFFLMINNCHQEPDMPLDKNIINVAKDRLFTIDVFRWVVSNCGKVFISSYCNNYLNYEGEYIDTYEDAKCYSSLLLTDKGYKDLKNHINHNNNHINLEEINKLVKELPTYDNIKKILFNMNLCCKTYYLTYEIATLEKYVLDYYFCKNDITKNLFENGNIDLIKTHINEGLMAIKKYGRYVCFSNFAYWEKFILIDTFVNFLFHKKFIGFGRIKKFFDIVKLYNNTIFCSHVKNNSYCDCKGYNNFNHIIKTIICLVHHNLLNIYSHHLDNFNCGNKKTRIFFKEIYVNIKKINLTANIPRLDDTIKRLNKKFHFN